MQKINSLWMYRIFGLVLIIILSAYFFASFSPAKNGKIKGGKFDYTSLALDDKQTILNLNGIWTFYPEMLLTQEEISSGTHKSYEALVPSPLESKEQGEYINEHNDYGTYYLTIHTGDDGVMYGMSYIYLNYASKVFINGNLIEGLCLGTVGSTKESTIPAYSKKTAYFPSKDGKIDIIMQYSNFYHNSSGILSEIRFGTQEAIMFNGNASTYNTSLIVGFLFALAILAICAFFTFGMKSMFLYLSIICVSIFLRQLIIDESLITIMFPTVKYWMLLKTEYLTMITAISFFVLFVDRLCPMTYSKHFIRGFMVYMFGYALFTLFAPTLLLSQSLGLIFAGIVVAVLSIVIVQVKYSLKHNDYTNGIILCIGLIFLFICIINDMIYYSQYVPNLITNGNRTVLGVIVMVYLHIYIIILQLYKISEEEKNFSVMLEMMIEKRTKALNTANKDANDARMDAEKALRVKDEFLANMSHEIRTPMNAIIGMTDLLCSENLTPRQLRYVNDIKSASTSLLGIINDILDLSKIESGRLSLVLVDYNFPQMLENIESFIMFTIQQGKDLEFKMEINSKLPKCVRGDDTRLRQAIVNLLSNAVKFTNVGYVKLSVAVDAETIIFEIEDTGIGIREEDLSNLFKPFSQVDTVKNRSIKGTGLGLVITKSIIEMMDGTITIDSIYGKGTIFQIRIPLVLGDEDKIMLRSEKFDFISAPKARILVVDDNGINLNVAEGLLNLCSIKPDLSTSGRDAIKKVQNNQYDIIFMDHMMPEMDGILATKIIRSFGGEHSKLPIVALTANVIVGAKEMFLDNGFTDFLSKPIDKAHLNHILTKWLPKEKIEAHIDEIKNADTQKDESLFLKKLKEANLYDVDAGLALVNFATDVYEKTLRLMVKLLPATIEKMINQIENNLYKDFIIEVHGTKGSLGSLGLDTLAEEALQLETSARDQDYQYCKDNTRAFADHLNDFYHAVHDIFKATDEAIKTEEKKAEEAISHAYSESDIDVLKEQLARLLMGIEEFDTEKVKEIMAEINIVTHEPSIAEALSEISGLMDEFNYGDALDKTNDIMAQL